MDVVILGPGEGEVLADTPQRRAEIKLGRDELAVTEFRYETGQRGPPPHVHREHSDGFWVLEGELTIELGGEVKKLGPGGFAMAPPGVVHTFRNEGPETGRFLNLHAPSMGFHDYLRVLRSGTDEERRAALESFDQWDPPADGGRPASEAVVFTREEGQQLEMGPTSATIKLGGGEVGGALAAMDTTIPPGFPGPVPHRHRETVDSFYVLEGTLTLRVEDRTVEAGRGTYVVVPPGTVHTFSNPGAEPVRFLSLMAPAGLDDLEPAG